MIYSIYDEEEFMTYINEPKYTINLGFISRLSFALRDNEQLMSIFLHRFGRNCEYTIKIVSERLLGNKEFMMSAYFINHNNVKYASEELIEKQ